MPVSARAELTEVGIAQQYGIGYLPLKVLEDPQVKFTMTPQNTIKYADFMYQVGSIKVKPASWKELFFPEVHSLPGS